MPQIKDRAEFDEEADKAEGLTPITCPSCGRQLARQTKDGNALVIQGESRSYNRVKLSCKCGKGTTWRPKRGPRLDKF